VEAHLAVGLPRKRKRKGNTVRKTFLTAFTASLLLAGLSFADDLIHDRKVNQQDRIAQGVKSGSLTPRETGHLENREANLNKEIRNDRKANGGNLTNNQKAQVNRQQNRLSNSIYRDKHN
jgi:hypothetical protein